MQILQPSGRNNQVTSCINMKTNAQKFNFDILPPEIFLNILQYCNGKSQINLESCCNTRLNRLISKTQQKVTILDVQSEYNVSQRITFYNFVDRILKRYPNLLKINLSGTPIYLDKNNVNKLMKLYPKLRSLNIAQKHAHPKLAPDLLTHLHSLTQLDSLYIDRLPLQIANDAVKRPLLMPEEKLFTNLRSLSLLCNSGFLFRLLLVMKTDWTNIQLKLTDIRLGNRSWVTLNDNDFELLIWLLKRTTESLKRISLQDFCFASERDSVELLRALVSMPNLGSIQLHSCTVRSLSTTYEEDNLTPSLIKCVNLKEIHVKSCDQIFSRAFKKLYANNRKLNCRMIYPDGIELKAT